MAVDLCSGVPVDNYPAALARYEKLFGSPPTFFPHDTEDGEEILRRPTRSRFDCVLLLCLDDSPACDASSS